MGLYDHYFDRLQQSFNSLPRALGRKWLKTHQHPKCLYDLIYKLPKGANVLDVGCGAGNTLRLFHECNADVNYWATDLKISDHLEVPPDTHVVQTDLAKENPFKEYFFDVVTCFFVLEHIELKNLDSFCNNLVSIIKPEGYIFLVFPNERSLMLGFYDDPTHIRPYSPLAVDKLMRNRNFSLEKRGRDRSWKILLLSPFYHLFSLIKKDPAGINFFFIHLAGTTSYYLGKKNRISIAEQ